MIYAKREAATPARPTSPPHDFGVPPKGAAPVREADVTKQVIDFLKALGWRPVRNNVGRIRRSYRFGEKGMADWTMIRYAPWNGGGFGRVAMFWLELKKPGEKLRPGQPEWIDAERAKGALVCVAHSLKSFQSWYEEVYG